MTSRGSSHLESYIRLRDKGSCVYCDGIGEVIDHVVPYAKGGPTVKGNLVLACHKCNCYKRDKLLLYYILKGIEHLVMLGEDTSWISRFMEPKAEEEPEPELEQYDIMDYARHCFAECGMSSDQVDAIMAKINRP